MKAMKKVISTVLLICMLAALLSVSAFAAGEVITIQGTPHTLDPTDKYEAVARYNLNNWADYDTTKTYDVQWLIKNNKVSGWTHCATEVLRTVSGEVKYTYSDLEKNATNYFKAIILCREDNSIKVEAETEYFVNVSPIKNDITSETTKTTKTLKLKPGSIKLDVNGTYQLEPWVNNEKWNDCTLFAWDSVDSKIATVDGNGIVKAVGPGTTDIYASLREDPTVTASCSVHVNGTELDVKIQLIPDELTVGVPYTIRAEITGTNAVFDGWSVKGGSVDIDRPDSTQATITPRAESNEVTLYARVTDKTTTPYKYVDTYVKFKVVASDRLLLEAYPNYVDKGLKSVVKVVEAYQGETFTWTVLPTGNDLIASQGKRGTDAYELIAGAGEGSATIKAVSNYGREASITVFFNMEASYGLAKITPAEVTWTPGQGNLIFEVSPAYYNGYIDGKALTPQSGGYTYYGGVLTIKSSVLSQLSPGVHTLKVNTSSGNGKDGLVYAKIRVNGSASSVYGDNTHVRGSSYNLYFNSTDPVKEVYISNQWIDPANYSVDSTGTRLTLNANFLNQLGYGTYTMKLTTQNGYTETANFRIVTANYAPATGDNSNLGAWAALLILSCVGAVVLIPKKKKSTDLVG